MTEVIGVRFRRSGKVYYFDPNGARLERDQAVIVETQRGMECGYVSIENIRLPEEMLPQAPQPIVRVADDFDRAEDEENRKLAKDAMDLCAVKIQEHSLDMKLVEAEYTFDKAKLIFYFSSEGRVDFRDLVRDLAQTFRTRIELRQIGVRDQAKMVGGIGSCGQEICCRRYMGGFAPVSIKMAKTQGLSLNPGKISGLCGRLMCCLNYEQEVYQENTKQVPANGCLVLTSEGQGYVVDRDVLQKRVRVHVYKDDNSEDEKYFPVDEIEILEKRKKGQRRPPLRTDLNGRVFVPKEAPKEEAGHDCSSCQKGCGASPVDTARVVYDSKDDAETMALPEGMTITTVSSKAEDFAETLESLEEASAIAEVLSAEALAGAESAIAAAAAVTAAVSSEEPGAQGAESAPEHAAPETETAETAETTEESDDEALYAFVGEADIPAPKGDRDRSSHSGRKPRRHGKKRPHSRSRKK